MVTKNLPVARNMAPAIHSNVVHIASGTDLDSGETLHRFLVDGSKVKYITAGLGVISMDKCAAAPSSTILPQLPKFPSGDWNSAALIKDFKTGRISFRSHSRTSLSGVRDLWHPTRIEQLELCATERLGHNVYVVSHPSLERSKAVTVFKHFPSEIVSMENTTEIYKAIEGHGIGYKFMGHMMEEGRAIGHFLEHIEGVRAPGPQDLGQCLRTVGKLHKLGYKHGAIAKNNFHVRGDIVWLISLWSATKCIDPKELKEELDIVAFVVAGIIPRFVLDARSQGRMEEALGEDEDKGLSISDGPVEPFPIEPSMEEAVQDDAKENSNVDAMFDPGKNMAVNLFTGAFVVGEQTNSNSEATTTTTNNPPGACTIKEGMGNVIIKAVEERSLRETGADAVVFPQPPQDDADSPSTDESPTIIFPDDQMKCDYEEAKRVIDKYSKLPLSTDVKATYTNALLAAGVAPDIVKAMLDTHPIPASKEEETLDLGTFIVEDQNMVVVLESKATSSVAEKTTESISPGISTELRREKSLEDVAAINLEYDRLGEIITVAQEIAEPTSNKVLLGAEIEDRDLGPSTTPPKDITVYNPTSALKKLADGEESHIDSVRQATEQDKTMDTTTMDDESQKNTFEYDGFNVMGTVKGQTEMVNLASLVVTGGVEWNHEAPLDSAAEADTAEESIFKGIIEPRTTKEWLDRLE